MVIEEARSKPMVIEEARSKPIKNLSTIYNQKNAQKVLKMQHPQN